MKWKILIAIFLPFNAFAQNIIVTVAGSRDAGFGGDNGLAIHAKIGQPDMFTLDKEGNIIFGDTRTSRIRKISATTGIITTIAGTTTQGYSGDHGPATNAELSFPDAFVFDDEGNLFFGDAQNYRLRRIDAKTGIITTIAGNGIPDFNGDNIPSVQAQLGSVTGICIDKQGNLFAADYTNKRIRKFDLSTGIISTVAGNGETGFGGDGEAATKAKIDAASVCIDNENNIYIADEWNHRVRKVDGTTGIITTIAGNGLPYSTGDRGLAILSGVTLPRGIFVDKQQNIYIAEEAGYRIRRIDAKTKTINTVAGTGEAGYNGDGGPATAAKLSCTNVYLDEKGVIYISDAHKNSIRKVFKPDSINFVSMCVGNSVWLNRNMPGGTWVSSDPQNVYVDTMFDRAHVSKPGNVEIVHQHPLMTKIFNVTIFPSLSVDAIVTPASCFGMMDGSIVTKMVDGIGPYKYTWNTGDSSSSLQALAADRYSISITDISSGCVATDTFTVSQPDSNDCENVVAYNWLSPNGDGVNDTWIIERIQNFPSNSVQVFDKKGDLVYQKDNYNNEWGGQSNNGILVPDGTYYYLVKLKTPTRPAPKAEYSGYLMIKR